MQICTNTFTETLCCSLKLCVAVPSDLYISPSSKLWNLYISHKTSSRVNAFGVTGPLWGESTSHWWLPSQMAGNAELWWFYVWRNKWLGKQWCCRWFKTPWKPCVVTVMAMPNDTNFYQCFECDPVHIRGVILDITQNDSVHRGLNYGVVWIYMKYRSKIILY